MAWFATPDANDLEQTYIKGFLDVSGDFIHRTGDFTVTGNKLFISGGDVSINTGNLYVGGNVSTNSNLSVTGATTSNQLIASGNIDISGATTLNGTLTVAGATTFNNVSIANNKTFTVGSGPSTFGGDVSMNSILIVGGNVLLNLTLNVTEATTLRNTTISGSLGVSGAPQFTNDASFVSNVTILGNLRAQYPANSIPLSAINGTLTVNSVFDTDVSMNARLSVAGATTLSSLTTTGFVSIVSTLDVTGATTLSSVTINNNAAVGGTMVVTGKSTFSNDVSLNGSRIDICGNLYAQYPANSIPISAINGTISKPNVFSTDASMNSRLNVAGATTMSSTLVVTGKSRFLNDVSFGAGSRIDICGNLYANYPANSIPAAAISGGVTVSNVLTTDISMTGNLLVRNQITLGTATLQATTASWRKLGGDIDGEAALDQSGYSVSLSKDGSIVAIGALLNDGTSGTSGDNRGHVRVYQRNVYNVWQQLGGDIDGEAANDQSGISVSLSSNGSIVAIGAFQNDGTSGTSGDNRGHVRVYQNISNVWTKVGNDIDGEFATDLFGFSLSLSSDGTTVAIGAYQNDGTSGISGDNRGHVEVYKNIDNVWTQLGQDIDGEAANDQSGYSVSLSSDGSIVAIGATQNDGTSGTSGDNRGHVRVYKNINNVWTQLGDDIDGETSADNFGLSVSLSSDGSIIAIGATLNDGTSGTSGDNRGHVRVYQNISNVWTQLGGDIDGEARLDWSGQSVSLSSDGSIVAIGAYFNDGTTGTSGDNRGHVRVYQRNISNTTIAPIGWTQLGADIDGEATLDQSGISVSLSSDGYTVAIGANLNDGTTASSDRGHVRVYNLNRPIIQSHPICTPSLITTGNTIAGSLSVSGLTTLSSLSATNTTVGGNLTIAGATTMTTLTALGAATMNTLSLTGKPTLSGNVSMNSKLSVGGDVSMNSRLFVGGDVSLNSKARFMGDVSLNSRLSVGGATTISNATTVGTLSVAGATTVASLTIASTPIVSGTQVFTGIRTLVGDVSMNSKLITGGDVSMNSTLTVVGDTNVTTFTTVGAANATTIGGTLAVTGATTITADVSMNARISVGRDVSMNSALTVLGNVYLNSTLAVTGATTMSTLTINNGSTIGGTLAVTGKSTFSNDVSFNGANITVAGSVRNSSSALANTLNFQYKTLSWTILGNDIDGEAMADNSGYSVSLSKDGSVVAIGAINNDGTTGNNRGHVRIYQRNASNTTVTPIGWTQLGGDIDGEFGDDQFGMSVSLSSDGSIVAIGATGNDGTSGSNRGHVEVYQRNTSNTTIAPIGWTQLGGDIDGESSGDGSGQTVSLSGDGSVVAIGANQNDGSGGDNRGHVRIYQRAISNTTVAPIGWTQLGGDIDGEVDGDQSGYSVALSSDGSIVAIGAIYSDGTINDSTDNRGHVRVYQRAISNTTIAPIGWTQLGGDIDGETVGDNSGYSVSLSSNGLIVAFGAIYSDGTTGSLGDNRGNVRVYQRDISNTTIVPIGWTQLGGDIDGEAAGDQSGASVSLSSDGLTIAISSNYSDGSGGTSGIDRGHVRVFQRNVSNTTVAPIGWTQVGTDIDGESFGDQSGQSVAISSDGLTLAVGASYNDGTTGTTGDNRGHVRIYRLNPSGLYANYDVIPTTMITPGNATVGGKLRVTGATSMSTLSVIGATTLTSLSASSNAIIGGTLGVTGATTIGGILAITGATTLTTMAASSNAIIGGTLGITGATTMTSVNVTGPIAQW